MPSLPNLRILQFAHSFVSRLLQKQLSSSEKYSRLQAIEFYSTDFGLDGISDELLSRIPNLSRLHFIGGRELCLFTEMIERRMPIGVEHLVLGILSPLILPLSEWNLHPNLISLTIFVGDQINEAFDAIRDCLTFNPTSLSAGCFRTLSLYITSRGDAATLVEGQLPYSQEDLVSIPCFQDILRLCSTHGIDLRCQVLDLSDWVTNWLYDTQPQRNPSLN
ncbi:hypothetical protein NLI96_g6403 [Meripilus lineatus]|uniref:Uncharacterized protein n=1 Tax=Meripilus lineatus TaxID=2056292 RepID=A0AAD5YI56_9APHY|nr:hypothetical protein NLI96_g6403 [Physisporinus lineatus]